MTPWACGIVDCDATFEEARQLIEHQVADHQPRECGVCGKPVPAGFLAIRHAFSEHTRAEYLRAYNADSDDIRVRETIKEEIERAVNVDALLTNIEAGDAAVSLGD